MAYLLVGSLAGILAGMFGVGGGIIIVPVLVFVFTFLGFDGSYLVHLAIGTSLATIFFTGISSARSHYLKESINKDIVVDSPPGIMRPSKQSKSSRHFTPFEPIPKS